MNPLRKLTVGVGGLLNARMAPQVGITESYTIDRLSPPLAKCWRQFQRGDSLLTKKPLPIPRESAVKKPGAGKAFKTSAQKTGD